MRARVGGSGTPQTLELVDGVAWKLTLAPPTAAGGDLASRLPLLAGYDFGGKKGWVRRSRRWSPVNSARAQYPPRWCDAD
eukprot:COSAG01_NODE_603_length_14905_cov_12.534648_4_plen_80_part_00